MVSYSKGQISRTGSCRDAANQRLRILSEQQKSALRHQYMDHVIFLKTVGSCLEDFRAMSLVAKASRTLHGQIPKPSNICKPRNVAAAMNFVHLGFV